MRVYEIVDTNADNIGACSFCGYRAGKNEGHRRKSDWLKKRYAEGQRFKVLRSREFGDIGMIEYALGSHAWRPVEAEGCLVIRLDSLSWRKEKSDHQACPSVSCVPSRSVPGIIGASGRCPLLRSLFKASTDEDSLPLTTDLVTRFCGRL